MNPGIIGSNKIPVCLFMPNKLLTTLACFDERYEKT